jgi:DNA-binding IclR family transcriptional regulator
MTKLTGYQVGSIVKAFRIMEVLATNGEFDLSRLCRLVGLPKTTVHRILLTLSSLGYVEQDPRSLRYRASAKLFELGASVVRQLSFAEVAKPYMVQLAETTGETINLGVLRGLDMVCIHKIESKHHLRLEQPLGSTVAAHCTSIGKSVLAFLSAAERSRLFSEQGIAPCTAKSLRTVDEVEEHLQMVRERGYAVDDEEGMAGICCVGAPIFDHSGKAVAGLSIAGPSSRLRDEGIDYLANLAGQTAGLISRKLGFSGETKV